MNRNRRVAAAIACLAVAVLATIWLTTRPAKLVTADIRTDGVGENAAGRHAKITQRINESIARRAIGPRDDSHDQRRRANADRPSSDTPPPGTTRSDSGSRDEYMQRALKEAFPLFKECYSNAQKASPDLGSGVLNVRFVVVADPSIGGVIETSEIMPDTAFSKNEGLAECIKESVYSLRFPPPVDSLREEISIPFEFGAPVRAE